MVSVVNPWLICGYHGLTIVTIFLFFIYFLYNKYVLTNFNS